MFENKNQLQECQACSNKISLEAKVCPNCGHPQSQKKDKSVSKIIWIGLFFIILAMVMKPDEKKRNPANNSPESANSNSIPDSKTTAKKSPIEQKYGPIPEANQWNGIYREVERYLEHNANDPDSIKIENCTKVSIDKKVGYIVGCNYRGKNAFGGMVKNANWFVIKNKEVVAMLPFDSYKE
jgi:hypothetical protein